MESEIDALRREVASLTEVVSILHKRVVEAENHIAKHGDKTNECIGTITTLVGGLVRQANDQATAKINAPKRPRFSWLGIP